MNNDDELRGEQAVRRAETMRKVRVNQDKWETEYLDEESGERWVMDYPDSALHGGGTPRLRRRNALQSE